MKADKMNKPKLERALGALKMINILDMHPSEILALRQSIETIEFLLKGIV